MIIVKNRKMVVPYDDMYIGTTYDDDSERRIFRIDRYAQNERDLSALTFRLDIKQPGQQADTVILDKDIDERYIYLIWNITNSVIRAVGLMFVQIRAIDNEATVKWSTYDAALYVARHLNTPGSYTGSLTEIEQMEQDHQYMKSVVDELKDNIDYAHDAEAWAKGTRSGSAVPSTDPTYQKNSKYYSDQASTKATEAAASANAAASSANQAASTVADTNNRFSNAMAAVTSNTELADIRTGFDGYIYTTAGDAVRGQVSVLNDDTMSVVKRSKVFTGNVVDLSDKTVSGQYIPWFMIESPGDGTYYRNPYVWSMEGQFQFQFLDHAGAAIEIRDESGTVVSNIVLEKGQMVLNEKTVTIIRYATEGKFGKKGWENRYKYTLAKEPYYWNVRTRWVYDLQHGLTKDAYFTTYVPYSAPTESRELRYGCLEKVGADIAEHIKEKSLPVDLLANSIESENLLDESLLDWSGDWDLGDGRHPIPMKEGVYIPVIAGRKIASNKAMSPIEFYDSSYTLISKISQISGNTIETIPDQCAYIRVKFYYNTTEVTNQNYGCDNPGEPIIVYYANDPGGTPKFTGDIKDDPAPKFRLDGRYVSPNVYKYSMPDFDGEFMDKVRYGIMREKNLERNVIRIGTLNLYVARTGGNWHTAAKLIRSKSVDVCCFQEVVTSFSGSQSNLIDYFQGWQFPYNDGLTIEQRANAVRAITSHFPVVSSDVYDTDANDRRILKCVINLPKYKSIQHQFTLSVYSIHLDLTLENRLNEVAIILQRIAQDTSDFVVVCGDTNAFASEIDESGKKPTWEAFVSNGFTLAHDGRYPTVITDDNSSIDQIFAGPNVSVLGYDIVDSNDVLIPRSNLPLSDHDFLYADLQFDFDAVIREKGYT